jgi:hypothetical protein
MAGKKNKKKRKTKPLLQDSSSDSRFEISSKPQFYRKSRTEFSQQQVVLDERFSSVLTDPRFRLDVEDKYGRDKKKNKGSKTNEELSPFYTVKKEEEEVDLPTRTSDDSSSDDTSSSSSSSHSDDEQSDFKQEIAIAKQREDGDKQEIGEEDPSSRIAYLTALSRGQLDVSSSSSDDDEDDSVDSEGDSSESDDEEKEEDDNELGKRGVLDPSYYAQQEVERTHEESTCLAVCGMDWSNVRAVDIFTIVSSFTPPSAVKRVRVFLSDFGQERLAAEERFGPVDVWKKKKKSTSANDSSNDAVSLDDQSVDEDGESDDLQNKLDGADEIMDSDQDTEEEDVQYLPEATEVDSAFDPEKLRAYEASKLKYYFAVVEFSTAQYADMAYKELDGLEFEHSSAAMDVRSIPETALADVVKDRPVRDEASNIPGNYEPPDFVINALQQTSVQCTWEMGDIEREKILTKYTTGQRWENLAESDDLKAYLASDVSSDGEESDGEKEKASTMRKLLGLDSDGDEDIKKTESESEESSQEEKAGTASSSRSESEDEEEGESKEAVFVPGRPKLEDKIRAQLELKDEKELTPWEKYQEKRKQKRRERRQAVRAKRKEVNERRKNAAQKGDNFFVQTASLDEESLETEQPTRQTREELELFVAGDCKEEEALDFDMRGLERIEKNKDKKLRGSRKRKEEKITENIAGKEFKIDVADDRFRALLDGSDDRFGIDRTDPSYKETSAMREILAEQTRRRKKNKRKKLESESNVAPDDDADHSTKPNAGSAALSALVRSIKSKVQ